MATSVRGLNEVIRVMHKAAAQEVARGHRVAMPGPRKTKAC